MRQLKKYNLGSKQTKKWIAVQVELNNAICA
jgi:hypothetical protein